MLIYLTGFMGAGKSTAGKKLAGLLGYSFVDLDTMIESETKKSISELFAAGQDKFREIEAHILRNTESMSNCVIAAGGGTPCFHDNMKWMINHGLTVYIKLSPGSLFHRLAPSKTSRPLIAGKSDVELMEYIMETLKDR
ncbi:MAG TPA: shikimate kinase, partial [Bacteroidia bacterium]|nr:shikimate kinase [Bacteroidia bacterium]